MADVEKVSEDNNDPILHVVLRTGQAFSIKAHRFEHQVGSEERFVVYDADGQAVDQIFLRASAVDCLIPQSFIAEASPFIEIHNRLEDHEARLRAVEGAISERPA